MAKTKMWYVYAQINASKLLGEVEAESAEEAIEKGWSLDTHVSLCHHCSRKVDLGDTFDLQVEEE